MTLRWLSAEATHDLAQGNVAARTDHCAKVVRDVAQEFVSAAGEAGRCGQLFD
jgi:hypothetical protein